MATKRYHVELIDDRGGFHSQALAADTGSVVSTTRRFDGIRDLALIDVSDDESAEILEQYLDADDNVVAYRCSAGQETQ